MRLSHTFADNGDDGVSLCMSCGYSASWVDVADDEQSDFAVVFRSGEWFLELKVRGYNRAL
jgi:hypothetical protein